MQCCGVNKEKASAGAELYCSMRRKKDERDGDEPDKNVGTDHASEEGMGKGKWVTVSWWGDDSILRV